VAVVMVAVTVVAAAVVIAAVTKVAKAVAVGKVAVGRAARASADPNAQPVAPEAGSISIRLFCVRRSGGQRK